MKSSPKQDLSYRTPGESKPGSRPGAEEGSFEKASSDWSLSFLQHILIFMVIYNLYIYIYLK